MSDWFNNEDTHRVTACAKNFYQGILVSPQSLRIKNRNDEDFM